MQQKLGLTNTWTLVWYWKAKYCAVIAINIEKYSKN